MVFIPIPLLAACDESRGSSSDPPNRGEGGAGGSVWPRVDSRWSEALRLWMRWNDAYEHASEAMFQAHADKQRLEQLMDQMDQIRLRAIELSRELLRP